MPPTQEISFVKREKAQIVIARSTSLISGLLRLKYVEDISNLLLRLFTYLT